MTTCGDLIESVLGDLLSSSREVYNEVRSPVAVDGTAIDFLRRSDAIAPNAVLEIGLESMLVWEADQTSSNVIVKRGFQGTTPVALVGGEFCTVNPRFSRARVLAAINDEIRAISGEGLYQVQTVELTSDAVSATYDLGVTDALDIYDVRWDAIGPENYWPRAESFELIRNVGDEFQSGFAVKLPYGVDPGRAIRVQVKREFAPLTNLTDDVAGTTGIPTSAHDILPLGAELRLMGVREAKRSFTESQGDARRATEVPGGSASRAVGTLLNLRSKRIAEEKMKLAAKYPTRRP